VKCGFVASLLECLDAAEAPAEQQKWSNEQRRKIQLEALSALFQLVQHVPDAFMDADGNQIILQLLQATRSREVQRKCLHLLQVAVRMGPHFCEDLGNMGAVGTLIELFTDKDNPMSSRQICASVLSFLCKGNAANAREFRKKDGVEAIRDEVVYRPDETTDNHLFYSLCVVDCVWNAVVGTRKNEIRFLDAGGLFALLDALEVAPMLLKRQIIGCLADLMEYKKAAKLFTQWNSQVTMKGALKLLLELWQNEQEAAGNMTQDGVIRDLEQPLNPRYADASGDPVQSESVEDGAESVLTGTSRAAGKFRHAKNFSDTAAGQSVTSNLLGSTARKAKFEKASMAGHERQGSMILQNASGKDQDCRAKIYAALKCIGFECQETLSITERQQMELVKLYPKAVELEMWIQVQESLVSRGIKPTSADRKFIEDSIAERKEQAAWVQGLQQKLADEKRSQEEAGLERFYEDIRGRAQIRKTTPAQTGSRGVHGEIDSASEGFAESSRGESP